MDVAGTGAPQRVELDGLRAELPADFALQGVRFSEAQLYLEFLSREAKLGLARLGFSDLHKGQLDETELQTRVMKMLFDRGEVTDPVSSAMMGPPRIFGPGVERAAGKTGRTGDDDVHRHPAGFYREKRRAHIRAGDWVVRKFGRRWSGGAAGLAWSCPETRALFAVCVRRGDEAAEAELRRFVETVRCHDAEAGKPVDWRPYVYAEAQLKPGARPKKEKLPDKGVRLSPLEMRRRQLRFRVRTQPEVRFEPSLKDETGSLIYPVRTGDGLVARVLRGGRPPETFHRRLALDPVGCKVWVGLADGPCVGELLADLSRDLGVHPVQLFPKLLAYLKMLGDRRLVDGVPDELAEPAPVAPAETASKAEN
ncbi:MAG: hypothetical protein M5U26_00375 [Planctomycetota bacterium]|nr:hypothetical protein [Planctomycetota bacterium]